MKSKPTNVNKFMHKKGRYGNLKSRVIGRGGEPANPNADLIKLSETDNYDLSSNEQSNIIKQYFGKYGSALKENHYLSDNAKNNLKLSKGENDGEENKYYKQIADEIKNIYTESNASERTNRINGLLSYLTAQYYACVPSDYNKNDTQDEIKQKTQDTIEQSDKQLEEHFEKIQDELADSGIKLNSKSGIVAQLKNYHNDMLQLASKCTVYKKELINKIDDKINYLENQKEKAKALADTKTYELELNQLINATAENDKSVATALKQKIELKKAEAKLNALQTNHTDKKTYELELNKLINATAKNDKSAATALKRKIELKKAKAELNALQANHAPKEKITKAQEKLDNIKNQKPQSNYEGLNDEQKKQFLNQYTKAEKILAKLEKAHKTEDIEQKIKQLKNKKTEVENEKNPKALPKKLNDFMQYETKTDVYTDANKVINSVKSGNTISLPPLPDKKSLKPINDKIEQINKLLNKLHEEVVIPIDSSSNPNKTAENYKKESNEILNELADKLRELGNLHETLRKVVATTKACEKYSQAAKRLYDALMETQSQQNISFPEKSLAGKKFRPIKHQPQKKAELSHRVTKISYEVKEESSVDILNKIGNKLKSKKYQDVPKSNIPENLTEEALRAVVAAFNEENGLNRKLLSGKKVTIKPGSKPGEFYIDIPKGIYIKDFLHYLQENASKYTEDNNKPKKEEDEISLTNKNNENKPEEEHEEISVSSLGGPGRG